jgi:NAD(P)-dependent dehydrogenase (short-subunit alcohol dehydrogenase family)
MVYRLSRCCFAPKFSAVKQKPLFPGSLREASKFYDAHIAFNRPRHVFAVLAETIPFIAIPIAMVATWFAGPLAPEWPATIAGTLLFARMLARGRVNRVRPDLRGRLAVITGATGGIGLEVAKQLAAMGCDLMILSRRTPQGAEEAMTAIRKCMIHPVGASASSSSSSPPTASEPIQTVEYHQLDVGSFVSVRDFVRRYRLRTDRPIDLLVNNAGVIHQTQVKNRHGDDEQLATNFLGPLLLTEGLLDHVAEANGRIVYVTSAMHVAVRKKVAESYLHKRGVWQPKLAAEFDGLEHYGFTKLGNIFHTQELAHRSYLVAQKKGIVEPRMKPVGTLINRADSTNETRKSTPQFTACCVHPGGVVTKIFRNTTVGWFFDKCSVICLLVLRTPYEGSQSVMNAALRPDIVNGGYYMNGMFCPNAMSEIACSTFERRAVMDWAHEKMTPYLVWSDMKGKDLPGTVKLPSGKAGEALAMAGSAPSEIASS